MKKLFTLFAAGLMAGNLMADVVGTPSVTTFGSLEDLNATAPELATLTAEVINNGSAVSVTSSDPELYWTYRFLPYYEERDSAEFVASIDPSIEQDNGLLEDMAWSIISRDAMIGSQNVYVPEWYEDGEELTFFAYGIANVGNGTVKRASNVVYISHFTYNPTATALQNITPEAKATKTVKIIKNGKLMILHNGKKFNIMGVEE